MRVCVLGLGRVGLPVALVVASKGHQVVGVDVDESVVKHLLDGEPPFSEPKLRKLLRELLKDSIPKFRPTTNLQAGIESSEVVLVCVGSRRYAKDNLPNLTPVRRLVEELGKQDLHKKLIVFKTTVPLGTTRQHVVQLETVSGLKCEQDFFVAFCPERMVEGRAIDEVETLPKIVAGAGPRSLQRALDFYRTIGGALLPVENTTAAEAVKLIDNAYRITRFAFANEIALLAEENGLDAEELIRIANSNYPRNSIPLPSCGVGGYCLTKDPWYLEASFAKISKQRGFHSLWLYSRKVNDFSVEWTAQRVQSALQRNGRELTKSRVLICGVTYKANVDDLRDSHGLVLAEKLRKSGAEVTIYDPQMHHKWEVGKPFRFQHDLREAFRGQDLAVFTVGHKEFRLLGKRLGWLVKGMRTRIIFDGAMIFTDLKPTKFELLRTGASPNGQHTYRSRPTRHTAC